MGATPIRRRLTCRPSSLIQQISAGGHRADAGDRLKDPAALGMVGIRISASMPRLAAIAAWRSCRRGEDRVAFNAAR